MKDRSVAEILNDFAKENCECGRKHDARFAEIIIEKGAISRVPEVVLSHGYKRVFLFADKNTYEVAGRKIYFDLLRAGITVFLHVLKKDTVKPDEYSVGSVTMALYERCDLILAAGSGVINDVGKLVARKANKPYMIFGTAPSMDGYMSATSSMSVGGFKLSLNSKLPDIIMTDTEIIAKAPDALLQAGIGDMIAKYVAICEWRISHIVTGEYYCPRIAELVLYSLNKCVSNLEGLVARDEQAVANVFEGLVLCGVGMNLAGCSRPASGVEHYFSHVWDMRGLAMGTPTALHGIQCAIGTRLAVREYEKLKKTTPSRELALKRVAEFDFDAFCDKLRAFIGKGAEQMISECIEDGRYDLALHAERIEVIISHWGEILDIIETLPSESEIVGILDRLGAPSCVEDIGLDGSMVNETFEATKAVRNKYILSSLYWDLGLFE